MSPYLELYVNARGQRPEVAKYLRHVADAIETGAISGETGEAWREVEGRFLTSNQNGTAQVQLWTGRQSGKTAAAREEMLCRLGAYAERTPKEIEGELATRQARSPAKSPQVIQEELARDIMDGKWPAPMSR